jgi:hypothetical protein
VVTTEPPGRLATITAWRMRATGTGWAAAAEWLGPDATIEVRHSRTPGNVPIPASYRPTRPHPQAVMTNEFSKAFRWRHAGMFALLGCEVRSEGGVDDLESRGA